MTKIVPETTTIMQLRNIVGKQASGHAEMFSGGAGTITVSHVGHRMAGNWPISLKGTKFILEYEEEPQGIKGRGGVITPPPPMAHWTKKTATKTMTSGTANPAWTFK